MSLLRFMRYQLVSEHTSIYGRRDEVGYVRGHGSNYLLSINKPSTQSQGDLPAITTSYAEESSYNSRTQSRLKNAYLLSPMRSLPARGIDPVLLLTIDSVTKPWSDERSREEPKRNTYSKPRNTYIIPQGHASKLTTPMENIAVNNASEIDAATQRSDFSHVIWHTMRTYKSWSAVSSYSAGMWLSDWRSSVLKSQFPVFAELVHPTEIRLEDDGPGIFNEPWVFLCVKIYHLGISIHPTFIEIAEYYEHSPPSDVATPCSLRRVYIVCRDWKSDSQRPRSVRLNAGTTLIFRSSVDVVYASEEVAKLPGERLVLGVMLCMSEVSAMGFNIPYDPCQCPVLRPDPSNRNAGIRAGGVPVVLVGLLVSRILRWEICFRRIEGSTTSSTIPGFPSGMLLPLFRYGNCAAPFDNDSRRNIVGRYARAANTIRTCPSPRGNCLSFVPVRMEKGTIAVVEEEIRSELCG
ncbi:hypothetical protein EDD15DRAFT_2197161 [Pisolithus albus]|nr:hypothetical protein EDD15DRAFT_2197161 [Pisolithus albus]